MSCDSVLKNEEFTLTEKEFRQINYLAISLVNRYFHEIFAKKASEQISEISTLGCGNTVWKLRNFTATIFSQKFRESNCFTKRKY